MLSYCSSRWKSIKPECSIAELEKVRNELVDKKKWECGSKHRA